jgi:tetratricopeptide (TPR) repeat protein
MLLSFLPHSAVRAAALPATLLLLSCLAACANPANGQAAAANERMVGVLGSSGQARQLPERKETASAPVEPAPRAAPLGTADAQASLRLAEDAYARGEWLVAAREFKSLTAVYPRNTQVWFGLGASNALAGNLEEASTAFDAALRIDPRDARVAYNLSLIRLSQAEVALSAASANSATAPPPVQAEISRLTRELGPVFSRTTESAPVAVAVPPAGFRMQDPARAAAKGLSGPASPLEALMGKAAAATGGPAQ